MTSTLGSLSPTAELGRLGAKIQLDSPAEATASRSGGASPRFVVGGVGGVGGSGINSGPVFGEEGTDGAGTPFGDPGALPAGNPGWLAQAASDPVRGPNTGCVGTGWNRGWL